MRVAKQGRECEAHSGYRPVLPPASISGNQKEGEGAALLTSDSRLLTFSVDSAEAEEFCCLTRLPPGKSRV